jgi:putative addiction module killer protein
MRVFEYLDRKGRSPFASWFKSLDARAAAKVTVALARVASGNFAHPKSVGGGVLEIRIDWGPGYRIYYGREGTEIVILLAGGTKQRQQDDIALARDRWQEHKQRKKEA